MNVVERRATLVLGSILALRMLGMFLILPVFALYAEHLEQATPALVGLVIGAYGLTQALFQIPFGLLSDRLGRKPVIAAGLILFCLGSVIAALSDSVYWVLVGRALQGAGAISAALMALAADLTREEVRTQSMAMLGMAIGMSFMLAMVLGPVLNHWIGVPGIFWLTAILALAGMGLMLLAVPTPVSSSVHRDAEPVPALFRRVMGDTQLLRLDFSILMLHLVVTATFVALPLLLRDQVGLPSQEHGYLYLGVLVIGVLGMVPFILLAEKKRRVKGVFLGAVGALGAAELALGSLRLEVVGVAMVLVVYFGAFSLLEALLPSLVSKVAPPESKGTAMGVYATSQFLGAFLGGLLGGWIHGRFHLGAVFTTLAMLAGVWLLVMIGMRRPQFLASRLVKVGELDAVQARLMAKRLLEVPGVAEAVVIAEEQVAYLKVDRTRLDEEALRQFAVA